jgi:predicted dehydrogenase
MSMPFNAPPDRPLKLHIDDGSNPSGGGIEEVVFETCDQYTIQGDLFSGAVLEHRPAPYPLEDSLENMRIIEAVFRSAESGRIVSLR